MAVKKAAARARFPFQYAVKFICTANIPGTSQTTSSFVPGSYQTAVNIHNPDAEKTAGFRTKIAVATSTEVNPPQISEFIKDALKPDQATKIDCSQISKYGIHLIHGFEGFLVIESLISLDVVAVYTAAGSDGKVESINVVHVPERRLG
jgi:hypothetical protein